MQILGICVVGFLLIFGIFQLSKDEPKPKKKEEPAPVSNIVGDTRERPAEMSDVPVWLARQFMIALANEDEDKIEELMAWDLLFAKIDDLNNRQPGERYRDLDQEGKQALRDKYITKVMDPDFTTIIREYALDSLMDNTFDSTSDVGIDYGNVDIMVEDSRGRPKLLMQIKSQLKPGKDTVRDAQNRSAWGIVTVLHQIQGKVNAAGQKVRTRRKNFADDLYAKKKKKKAKKKRHAGPPEADPKLVDWPEGMSAATKSKIESQVADLIQDDDFRRAREAKDLLMERGKPAIPGLLRALSKLDFEEDKDEVAQAWQIIQTLREITGLNFNFRPMMTRLALGMGGMTRATPEERLKAVRRWFGWWEKNAKTWKGKKIVDDARTWDDLVPKDKDKEKKKNTQK